MYLEAQDIRPASALRPMRVDGAQVAGGLLALLLVPAAALLAALAFREVAERVIGARDEPAMAEMEVIEAEFVRLGEELDPHRLPNREVPLQATAPDDSVVVSKDPDPPAEERPDAGVEPPDHAEVDELMRNLQAKAHKFAEIAEQRELEGSPEGIPEGTAEKATAGSMLGIFFRKGWDVPNTLTPDQLEGLVAHVRVQIAQDLTVGGYELERESSNPVFDQAVLDQLQRLQKADARVPDAPDAPADQYRGQTVIIRFHGKDAQ